MTNDPNAIEKDEKVQIFQYQKKEKEKKKNQVKRKEVTEKAPIKTNIVGITWSEKAHQIFQRPLLFRWPNFFFSFFVHFFTLSLHLGPFSKRKILFFHIWFFVFFFFSVRFRLFLAIIISFTLVMYTGIAVGFFFSCFVLFLISVSWTD